MSIGQPASASPDRQIVSTRLIDAPRERVFQAFSDPAVLARWWGPDGFTNAFHAFDFRPGGAWRFTMHGPDGAAYEMNKEFVQVVPAERIVIRHVQQGHDFVMTVTLADEAGGTRIVWMMEFASADQLQPIRHLIAEANEQNFDRLEAELAVRR